MQVPWYESNSLMEMNDLLSQKIERSELHEGDHIYSWRKNLYGHHGIFIGEDKVIHFGSTGGRARGFRFSAPSGSGGGQMQKTPCPKSYCGLEKVPKSGVRQSCIDCFIKKGSVYRYKYQVSPSFLFTKSRGGTCTTAESDPPEEVIHRATYLHENGYGKYHLMNNNCEDFALYCKTGLWSIDISYQGRSSQANMVHPTTRPEENHADEVDKIIHSLHRMLDKITHSLHRTAAAVPRSFSKRVKKDLGIRKDVVKVPVEELSSFILSLK